MITCRVCRAPNDGTLPRCWQCHSKLTGKALPQVVGALGFAVALGVALVRYLPTAKPATQPPARAPEPPAASVTGDDFSAWFARELTDRCHYMPKGTTPTRATVDMEVTTRPGLKYNVWYFDALSFERQADGWSCFVGDDANRGRCMIAMAHCPK